MTYEPPRCFRCQDHLFSDIEVDTGVCGHCADAMYENEQARREWEYYHPGEPMPPSEYPNKKPTHG